jgi:hypothetical protein
LKASQLMRIKDGLLDGVLGRWVAAKLGISEITTAGTVGTHVSGRFRSRCHRFPAMLGAVCVKAGGADIVKGHGTRRFLGRARDDRDYQYRKAVWRRRIGDPT